MAPLQRRSSTVKREHTTTVLLSLGQKLNSAITPEQAGNIILEAAEELLGWDSSFIYQLDRNTGGLLPVINCDTVDGKKIPVPPVYHGTKPSPLAREVLERGAKLILREAPEFTQAALPFGDKSRPSASLMFVPIRNGEQVVGLLSAQSYTLDAYTKSDLIALQSLADYCGGALERIRTIEALRESELQFRTLCESLPTGIFKTDAQGNCSYHNSRLLALAEISIQDCMGEGWTNTVHPEDRAGVLKAWIDAYAENREWSNEHRMQTKGGRIRWVRTLARPVLNEDGSLAGYVGSVEDITDRKRSDEALKAVQQQLKEHAEKLEARVAERTAKLEETVHSLESFSYSIAHDLRAPLRAMQGLTSILADEYGPSLDDFGQDITRRIVESARRMDKLIEDLLSYSRLSRDELVLTATNIEPAIAVVLGQLNEELTLRNAKVEVAKPLPIVYANATVIEQIFVNLISNAVKFVQQGTTPLVRIRTETSGSLVKIWVEDNGIGIAPQHHQKIFGVFQRLHAVSDYPGTGIGLAIVRKGVDRMGGRVGLESELGKGSRFWIELPAA